ncbi:hypothetical protein PV328_003006 [Microctonus aethiopoides]|uniref:Uncharacterized protein n=1 Tax=Microctonus aethiopoides TaxID=144406 RepID=A0AA39F7G8_9HYME|nr:hypothetical protein PV328_003006 [Microctonus aethiopoides]
MLSDFIPLISQEFTALDDTGYLTISASLEKSSKTAANVRLRECIYKRMNEEEKKCLRCNTKWSLVKIVVVNDNDDDDDDDDDDDNCGGLGMGIITDSTEFQTLSEAGNPIEHDRRSAGFASLRYAQPVNKWIDNLDPRVQVVLKITTLNKANNIS